MDKLSNSNNLTLSDNEKQVLITLLRIDMDVVGLDKKEQSAVRSILKKLKGP